jgi:UDP:flavonoid glycosyltransferase YjiC (YdhE family)
MSADPPRRMLLGAFGDPGHAFPMIALGRALAGRGHEVVLQTWRRWKGQVEAEGLTFAAAPEYEVFPSGPEPLDFYEAVVHATADTLPLVRELRPDVVVADILTLAPALAAELEGLPCATLIPHVYPHGEPDFPIYSLGARLPRSGLGRALWRRAQGPITRGLELGRVELNHTRARLGLAPLDHVHGGISRELALVGTFPQLEYPRSWPAPVHVVGPLMWEPPAADVELPAGDGPLVLIAPSTAQDPEHRLLRAALRGLADAPVRVLATWNRRLPPRPLRVPENARVVDWVSYSRTMPRCDVVVCHGGHGTLARALACSCAVVAAPAVGDMNENAARLDWAGAGVRVPRRFVSPRVLRLAVERALGEPSIRERARELGAWAEGHDAGATAARLVEGLASRTAAAALGGRRRHGFHRDAAGR